MTLGCNQRTWKWRRPSSHFSHLFWLFFLYSCLCIYKIYIYIYIYIFSFSPVFFYPWIYHLLKFFIFSTFWLEFLLPDCHPIAGRLKREVPRTPARCLSGFLQRRFMGQFEAGDGSLKQSIEAIGPSIQQLPHIPRTWEEEKENPKESQLPIQLPRNEIPREPFRNENRRFIFRVVMHLFIVAAIVVVEMDAAGRGCSGPRPLGLPASLPRTPEQPKHCTIKE